jgi:hypothetical protein
VGRNDIKDIKHITTKINMWPQSVLYGIKHTKSSVKQVQCTCLGPGCISEGSLVQGGMSSRRPARSKEEWGLWGQQKLKWSLKR